MGCGSSKAEESPLVVLCKERKELIRAAAEHRYTLASAHVSYFQALAGVGEALHRFVHEELTVMPSPSSSPVISLPPSDGKKAKARSKPRISTGNGNVGGDGEVSGGGVSSSSFSSSIHSLSPEDGHLHFSSGLGSNADSEDGGGGGGGGGDSSSSSPPPPLSAVSSPNYYYMRSSTAVPHVVYEDPYAVRWSNSSYAEYGYGYGYPPYGVSMGSSPAAGDDPYYYDRPMMSPPRAAAAPAPPPPPPEGSSWDFLNPFGSYEQVLPGYYQGRFGMGSMLSSPNSSEVREQEGIPDLEEETEQESVKVVVEKEKKVVGGDLGGKDSGIGSSMAAAAQEKDDTVVTKEKESQSNSEASKVKSSREEEAYAKKKAVSFEEETSLVTEDSRPGNSGTALSADGTRDVGEVVKEIKEHFRSAASCGEEVSRMLEVGKLPYRSRKRLFTVISSRILDPMTLPMLASSRPSFKRSQHSAASILKMAKASNMDCEKHITMKFGNLSSTLEKLYVWEKKLHKEVKDEEKLRVIYDKMCKRLKALDDRGAESSKIDSTRASIRKLLTKISIVIKSMNAISSRVHKIRDEELQPQLIELIQGLIGMWKSMLDCHQKQFQAIVESKSRNLMARTGIHRNSVAKATIELELELLNWCSCFNNWIGAQKAYIEALNGWLMKWLLEEKEETPDGVVPFSPSRIGAPTIFIISNDWHRAIKRIPEVKVTTEMQAFAARIHKLWESQGEEQRQKLKADYLSKDLASRLKSLQKETEMHGYLDASEKTVVSVSDNGGAPVDDQTAALDSMRKRLDEERAKHEEAMKQVQGAASSSLRTGLIPIFQALGNFTLDTLRAYEGLGIPNVSGGTQSTQPNTTNFG